MGDVSETRLPGVGVRHDFTTGGGERMGVISHRGGRKDLLVYRQDDPDACGLVVRLDQEDVRTLSDVLGGSEVTEGLTRLQSIPGLAIDWVPVRRTSACSGCRLGDLELTRDAGAAVVAVIRDDRTIASPPPDFVFHDGDTAVAVGTAEGVRRAFEVLSGS
jgi:TrkA domain protein